MSRPSAPLLNWLREMLKSKNLNTARVAKGAGIPRGRVRKILTGAEDMTVDELMMLSDFLDLDPADLSAVRLPEAEASETEPSPVAETSPETAGPMVDPWGNQPEQLFKIGFALGCDFIFLADATQLADSGVPQTVIKQYRGRELPIKLEAAYHIYNEPRYDAEGITLTLSFDQLYECTFKWEAVKQIMFFPTSPEKPQQSEPVPEDTEKPAVPHLRLVT